MPNVVHPTTQDHPIGILTNNTGIETGQHVLRAIARFPHRDVREFQPLMIERLHRQRDITILTSTSRRDRVPKKGDLFAGL